MDFKCKKDELAVKRPKLQTVCWSVGCDVKEWWLRIWFLGKKNRHALYYWVYWHWLIHVHVSHLHF